MIGSRQGFPAPVCPLCVRSFPPGAIACPWCGHRFTAAGGPNAVRRNATGAGLLAGGALVALSPVLPWLRAVPPGAVSLFDLSVSGPSRAAAMPVVLAPVAVVVIGVVAMASGLLLPRGTAARVTAGLLAGIAVLVGVLVLVAVFRADSAGAARIGAGPWLALAGAAVLAGTAVLPVSGAGPPPGSALRRQSVPMVGTAVVAVFAALGLVALFGAAARARVEVPVAAMPGPPQPQPVAPVPSTTSPAPTPATTTVPPPPPPPPTTTVTATAPAEPVNDLAAAEKLVRGKGYRPVPNTTWQPVYGLHVIVAVLAETGDGYDQRAFFFHDSRGYLGTDTSGASAGVAEVWATDDTVALTYSLYHVGDPQCCPTAGAATVRYFWNGARLVPLDPIPSDDSRAAVSRR
ncbi:LppP/LprE family lipoprotein [Amycolatopsis sp. NPDC059021]|uniref:LppP/LprE family lipoprotein n=1 Tax=Amycolatopsis sp. NPDC059021 TaxID=3346704 RepID=UPI00366EB451